MAPRTLSNPASNGQLDRGGRASFGRPVPNLSQPLSLTGASFWHCVWASARQALGRVLTYFGCRRRQRRCFSVLTTSGCSVIDGSDVVGHLNAATDNADSLTARFGCRHSTGSLSLPACSPDNALTGLALSPGSLGTPAEYTRGLWAAAASHRLNWWTLGLCWTTTRLAEQDSARKGRRLVADVSSREGMEVRNGRRTRGEISRTQPSLNDAGIRCVASDCPLLAIVASKRSVEKGLISMGERDWVLI